MAFRLRTETRNDMLTDLKNVVFAEVNEFLIEIYTGSRGAIGTTPGTLLSRHPGGNMSTPSNGTMVIPVSQTVTGGFNTALASGTPGYFVFKDPEENIMFDGTCTINGSGGDMTFDNTTFVLGGEVKITSLSVTMPVGDE